MFSNISKKTFFLLPALFLSSYVIGAGAGSLTSAAAEGNWGLSFHEENTPPTANASTDELAQYDAYYMQDTDEKIQVEEIENVKEPEIECVKEQRHGQDGQHI